MKTKKQYNGLDQCRAVLRVWSGKWKVAHVCQELEIRPDVLKRWQERAMEGMLLALAPREMRELEEKGPALPPKLRRLLERKAEAQEGKLPRLARRLTAALEASPGGNMEVK